MIATCPRCDYKFDAASPGRATCPSCAFPFLPGDDALEATAAPEQYLRRQLAAVTAEAPDARGDVCCYVHPAAEAAGICQGCNRPICAWCNVPEGHAILCETCFFNDVVVRKRARPHRPSLIPAVPFDARQPIAWELRGSLGRSDALQRTWRSIMLQPAEFFRRMPLAGDSWSPLIFALSWAMLGLLLRRVWRIGHLLLLYRSSVDHGATLGMLGGIWSALGREVWWVVLIPAIALTMFLAEVAIMQTLLLIVGERHARWRITWRLSGYAAAPWVLLLVPGVGVAVALATHLGVLATALRQGYHLGAARAWTVSCVPYGVAVLVWYRLTVQTWAAAGYRFVFGG